MADAAGNAAAADLSFRFFALTGDINRDRSVNGTDFALLAGNFGKSGMAYGDGDLNADGAVNGSDFALLAGNFGKSLGAAPAAPAPVVAASGPAASALPSPTAVATPRDQPTAGRRRSLAAETRAARRGKPLARATRP
jgi:hypothetical protein